jgi:HEAT repeat protein
LINGCIGLIEGGDADGALIVALGGPYARRLLGGEPGNDQRYWFRVWGIRGLLWAWDDRALDAVVLALGDPAWRVREMAAKVSARHRLGDTLPALVELRDDPVPRVRAAAARAIALLTQAGA